MTFFCFCQFVLLVRMCFWLGQQCELLAVLQESHQYSLRFVSPGLGGVDADPLLQQHLDYPICQVAGSTGVDLSIILVTLTSCRLCQADPLTRTEFFHGWSCSSLTCAVLAQMRCR